MDLKNLQFLNNFKNFQFFKSSVGLYIGPKTVQVAQLQLIAGKAHLTNFVHVDIYEDEQKLATSERDDLVVAALRKAIHKAKVDIKRINTILMPGMVLLRYFQMPRIPPEEMEEAVKFEARKYIPFKLEEAVTGFFILKEDAESKKIGILSLVTKEEAIKNHLLLLKKVGISPISIETASFSLIRLLEYSQELEPQKTNAVVYLYAQRVNIIILKNGVPYFVRDISLARKEEWIDDETAELLVNKEISPVDTRLVILENCLSEIRISFEYYKKELGKEEVGKIILCGEVDTFDDSSVMQEIVKEKADVQCPLAVYFQKKLNITVSTINPLKSVHSPKAKPLPYTFPMLGVTVGAGLKNLVKSTAEIDLFKARQAPRIKKKIFINKMLLVEIAALLLGFALLYFLLSIFVAREKNLLDKEKQKSPKFADLSHFSNDQLVKGEKEIQKRVNVYKKFIEERVFLTEKLNVIPGQIPVGIWLKRIEYKNISSETEAKVELNMFGSAYSAVKGLEVEMINQFSEGLKKDEIFFKNFKTVKTGSVSKSGIKGASLMNFELLWSSKVEVE